MRRLTGQCGNRSSRQLGAGGAASVPGDSSPEGDALSLKLALSKCFFNLIRRMLNGEAAGPPDSKPSKTPALGLRVFICPVGEHIGFDRGPTGAKGGIHQLKIGSLEVSKAVQELPGIELGIIVTAAVQQLNALPPWLYPSM